MSELRAGHASGADWEAVLESCLEQTDSDSSADLGFVYVTDPFAVVLPRIIERLRERRATTRWVGSVGLGVCASGAEYFDVPAMSILCGTFPSDAFKVFDPIGSDFARFDAQCGAWCAACEPYFGVVHGDPRNGAMPATVAALAARTTSGFLVGGLTSARDRLVQIVDGVVDGGLSGVLFSDQVRISTRLTQGCAPIGPRRRITACEGNIIAEIDSRPAIEVLYEDIGEVLARNPRQIGGYIFAALPVVGSDTGDYLVRNLVGIDPDQGLVAIAESVRVGDGLMFCRRDAASAESDLRRMLRELKGSLDGPIRGGLYFSCLARGPNLFGSDPGEAGIITEELGEFPMAGFFANGEISHDRLYAYTGVLTLFT